ncbi:outer membrane lipoprotein chaperone LolA [Lysobacter sp. HDW10]|uniref:outer membrane lipoprotein chaperone LolA n=1 Tax=Lysobacter sp. HDW10 TaxID=2714936 RepID=UPI00140A2CD2|nr:outer membrane lipoprotein chaperone LolA [Lysobacter sp. HDW10]QIK81708.1 outer membrane lipoprotein chaperone LolA [Lysobacter sp. HDW10]
MTLTKALTAATVAFVLMPMAAYASGREQLNQFTQGLKTVRGGFAQQVYDPKGRLKTSSSGRVSMSKPNLFRWEYVKPYQQLIIADGTFVWIHEPDLNQVTKRAQGAEEQNSPLTVLTDPKKLDAMFNVREGAKQNGIEWLELTPKNKGEANIESARLGFKDNQLYAVDLKDALGQTTKMVFAKWERNVSLPASNFKFVVPKGTDVVGE